MCQVSGNRGTTSGTFPHGPKQSDRPVCHIVQMFGYNGTRRGYFRLHRIMTNFTLLVFDPSTDKTFITVKRMTPSHTAGGHSHVYRQGHRTLAC